MSAINSDVKNIAYKHHEYLKKLMDDAGITYTTIRFAQLRFFLSHPAHKLALSDQDIDTIFQNTRTEFGLSSTENSAAVAENVGDAQKIIFFILSEGILAVYRNRDAGIIIPEYKKSSHDRFASDLLGLPRSFSQKMWLLFFGSYVRFAAFVIVPVSLLFSLIPEDEASRLTRVRESVHFTCAQKLKELLRDPSSYASDGTVYAFMSDGKMLRGDVWSLTWDYRAKNGFGGFTTSTATCEVARSGIQMDAGKVEVRISR